MKNPIMPLSLEASREHKKEIMITHSWQEELGPAGSCWFKEDFSGPLRILQEAKSPVSLPEVAFPL